MIEMENKYNKILAICLCMKQLLATNKLIQKEKNAQVMLMLPMFWGLNLEKKPVSILFTGSLSRLFSNVVYKLKNSKSKKPIWPKFIPMCCHFL